MKFEEYIKNMDNLNEEFDEGLLLELQEKPPTDLHGEIMKSVNRERKKVNFFNYKIYAPAIAAVLVFAVVINRPEILEKLNLTKNVKITQKHNQENTDPKTNINQNKIENPDVSNNTKVAINTEKPQDTETSLPNDSIQNTPSDSSNPTQQRDTNLKDEQDNTTEHNNDNNTEIPSKDSINKPNALPVEENTATDNNINEEKQLSIANLWGMLFFKEPDVNYEIVIDLNRSPILNFITENYEEKLRAPNTYKLSIDQFDSLDKLLIKNNISKKVINESDATTSKVIKINFVNYHITINDSEPDIIKFIEDQEKSVKIDDNTYKITLGNMSELDKILSSSGIKKEFISEVAEEYVIIKTLIINYEISIDPSQTVAVSFLKDTEKCVPIKDSVYKLSRESLTKLKELITDPTIAVKVLNETNNYDIIIKVDTI